MAETVIDVLEAAQIEKEHCKTLKRFAVLFDQRADVFDQGAAIGQFGQRIVVSHPLDMRLAFLALGDIEIGRTYPDLAPFFIVHRGTDMLEPDHPVVSAQQAQLEALRLATLVDKMQMMGPAPPVLRMDEKVHQVGRLVELRRRIAGHRQTGRRDIFIVAVDAAKVGKLLGQIGNRPKLLSLLLQLRFQQGGTPQQETYDNAND